MILSSRFLAEHILPQFLRKKKEASLFGPVLEYFDYNMLKSGFQGAIFLFIFCFPFLFRKPVRLGGDGLGNVVVGQAGFADDGEADGRDPAQIAERRRDGAHGAARAGGGGIAAHELVGEDHAGRAVGDGDIHHLRPRRDDAAEIDRHGRADERLQGEQRQLVRVGTGEHGGNGGEKAVFVGIVKPDSVFRVLGRGVEKNEVVRGIGAVGLRLRLGGAEEGWLMKRKTLPPV